MGMLHSNRQAQASGMRKHHAPSGAHCAARSTLGVSLVHPKPKKSSLRWSQSRGHPKLCISERRVMRRTERGKAERQGSDGGPQAASVKLNSLALILFTLVLLVSLRSRPWGPRSGACAQAKTAWL